MIKGFCTSFLIPFFTFPPSFFLSFSHKRNIRKKGIYDLFACFWVLLFFFTFAFVFILAIFGLHLNSLSSYFHSPIKKRIVLALEFITIFTPLLSLVYSLTPFGRSLNPSHVKVIILFKTSEDIFWLLASDLIIIHPFIFHFNIPDLFCKSKSFIRYFFPLNTF